jgi:hypothetical protein
MSDSAVWNDSRLAYCDVVSVLAAGAVNIFVLIFALLPLGLVAYLLVLLLVCGGGD